jgi:hypothetical protein
MAEVGAVLVAVLDAPLPFLHPLILLCVEVRLAVLLLRARLTAAHPHRDQRSGARLQVRPTVRARREQASLRLYAMHHDLFLLAPTTLSRPIQPPSSDFCNVAYMRSKGRLPSDLPMPSL